MSPAAIKVNGLWKEYVVGSAQRNHSTFYDLLAHSLKAPFQRARKLSGGSISDDRFWALRDINFSVQPGEVLGIVGRNGAGKSTLLKVLSRITSPTRGKLTLRGRLASLLEVGTGFHPELTGRENIYLNATILGMTQAEINRKFDAIVDFSGVERFLDTPVKRYSSGMYVRLAFAVAAHVEADTMLIDEVLAVGDAEFQKRCMGMMGDVARGGRAILFVSHNLTALRNLCSTGLLLEGGQVTASGSIGDVLDRYSSARSTLGEATVELIDTHPNAAAYIQRVAVVPRGRDSGTISVKDSFSIVTRVMIREADAEMGVFLHCHDANQARVFSTGSFFNPKLNGKKFGAGMHEFTCDIPSDLLNDGEYSLDVILIRNRQEILATESSVLNFRIQDAPLGVDGWNWAAVGVIRPQLAWSHSG